MDLLCTGVVLVDERRVFSRDSTHQGPRLALIYLIHYHVINENKDYISSFTLGEQLNTCIIYMPKVLTRIREQDPTDKICTFFFYEQVAYERDTKTVKSLTW